jgi:tellurite resistance protein
MYLAILSAEEKELFLELAYNLATSDGIYSDEEKEYMRCYCHEMQCEFNENMIVRSVKQIIERYNEISDLKGKKIIVFEAIGLAMADGNFDEGERNILIGIENEFCIEKGFVDKCEKVINEYISFQSKINNLVLG